MSRETKARVGMAVFVVVVFALGFVARGAVDRYRTADTDMTAMWRSVIPGSTMKLSSTPCYPVEALAPAVAHEFARLLNTSVEALMGAGRNSFVLRGELSEPYTFSCTMFPKGDAEAPGASKAPEESLALLPSPLLQTCILGYHEEAGEEPGTGTPDGLCPGLSWCVGARRPYPR